MGTWTLTANFNEIDGTTSPTKQVKISSNVQVTTDDGVIFDPAIVTVVDGAFSVELPAPGDGVNPDAFGFRLHRGNGQTKRWDFPAQTAGTTHALKDFTQTTPLPVPDTFDAQMTALTERVAELEASAQAGAPQIALDTDAVPYFTIGA